MTALTAELSKIRSTRAAPALLIGATVVVAFGAFGTVSSSAADDLSGPMHEQPLFDVAAINLSIFAAILGVRSVTDEFRDGTIAWTLLAIRRRWTVISSKAVVAGAAGSVMSLISLFVGGTVGLMMATAKGGNLLVTGADAGAVVRTALATGTWAMLGVAVGALVRHQVGATVAVLVWILAIENLGSAMLGGLADVLPGQAGLALAGAGDRVALHPVAGGLVLLAYVAGLSLAAIVSLDRRPVMLSA